MHEIDYKAMGERIRKERIHHNMSRETLAEKLDITTKFCADIESGARGVSIKTLVRLSECLMVSADYILLGDSSATSDQIFLRAFSRCPDNKKKYLLSVIETLIESYNNM